MRVEKIGGGIRLTELAWWQRAALIVIGGGAFVYFCVFRGDYWGAGIAVATFLANRRLQERVNEPDADPRSDPSVPLDNLQRR